MYGTDAQHYRSYIQGGQNNAHFSIYLHHIDATTQDFTKMFRVQQNKD